MELKYIGNIYKDKYPNLTVYLNLIENKTYSIIGNICKDDDGDEWVLIKNEKGDEVKYNTKYFNKI